MILLSLLSAAVLVAVDQAVKFVVALHIPFQPYGDATFPLIPGVLGISHTRNTGAAWSILASSTWLLAVLSAAASLFVLYCILRRKITNPLGSWALVLILAGAVGNLIDRIRLGYVVDMFRFLFVSFPVFNVADVCITVGGVMLCIYILFFYGKSQKGQRDGDHLSTP
ncbi:MAG: signal peptidase II [Oscillospiraceae bacterium]|jgi:signal peptidase II